VRKNSAPARAAAMLVVVSGVTMQRTTSSGLAPDASGIALRPEHYRYLHEHQPALDYVEVPSEVFLTPALRPRRHLAWIAERYPVVLHGASLNLLGHAPLDEAYLDALAGLADAVDAPFVTDHLCWTGADGLAHHDLLPTPYTAALVDLAAERAAYVQRRIGRRFGLENLASYVAFAESTMTEWEFYTRVVRDAGCWFLLDLNNVYVSAENHGFDPRGYLDAIEFSRVLQVHLGGHRRQADGLVLDSHDQPIDDAVWQLYGDAWRRGGPFPTLVEWDAAIPELPVLLGELDRAQRTRELAA
jgi:uncharacterized protein (UPF0276 family)